MAIAGYAVGASRGLHLSAFRVPRRCRVLGRPDRDREQRGLARAKIFWTRGSASIFRCGSAGRLYLWRRNLDVGKPRGQARHGPRQASNSRHLSGFSANLPLSTTCSLWSACRHPRTRCQGLRGTSVPRARAGRKSSNSAETSPMAGCSSRPSVSRWRSGERLRRWHPVGPTRSRRTGRRSARRLHPRLRNSTSPPTTNHSHAADAMLGHGGIVVFDDTVDMAAMARFAMEFCAEESCGKCTPCRVGAVRGVEVLDRIVGGRGPRRQSRPTERLVRADDRGIAVRDGGIDAESGAKRSPAFPRRLHGRTE